MCVTNIYFDKYPDGHVVEFRQLSHCQYGSPGRPCPTLSSIENPVRKINFGEPTTEQMLGARPLPMHHQPFIISERHYSPHRRSSSHRRHASSDSGHHRKSSRHLHSPVRPTRQHRKERIIIVDSPPTPRTPPQKYHQTFSTPSSPASPLYQLRDHDRARPIIVDERPLIRETVVPVVVTPRPRSPSRTRQAIWDSPSNLHTSFNSRLRREEEELRIRQRQIDIEREAEERKQAFIHEQNKEIRRRPAVPMPPPLLRRGYTKPIVTVVDRVDMLPTMMGALSLEETEYERVRREQMEDEAQKQRLKERQMPKRRFSVGLGSRRHRIAYDDGMYRYD